MEARCFILLPNFILRTCIFKFNTCYCAEYPSNVSAFIVYWCGLDVLLGSVLLNHEYTYFNEARSKSNHITEKFNSGWVFLIQAFHSDLQLPFHPVQNTSEFNSLRPL